VLLPQEYLGRRYYPTLAGAVLLSATTWLRGGFESAAAYLGLSRAAEPAPEEEREPCLVSAFRAPEVFDYSRVLVCAPRDAPAVHDKQAFLEHTARFLAYLAERTRGRVLGLFTNAEDLARVGQQLTPFFAARRIPFWWQRMAGVSKEELGQLFRAHVDSVLLGLDTFWYGADFPGSTLEYLVLVRLPYGVPDRYHHAQCAVLGSAEQRRVIYLPRALSKFRQGFGRLMRKESDRGCIFVLDRRVLDPRHRVFLKELPLRSELEARSGQPSARLARLVTGDSDQCLAEAFKHMGMGADLERRGLQRPFAGWCPDVGR
jgi:ATP-dependent DNA helicase DinG